ncbi:hypothetical protein KJ652_01550 [Patescibacteria group bacterium]|nr:hypothetical protein [Patescibacteria group bacterium]MBU1123253.1 hypothetical protein [Patescibacteria group bacterium]MBU1911567.1 hypothetical protein [Patescibacteria group bacterium]
MNNGKLVLIIGPSGVGKSVILKKLKDDHPELHFPRSATTRERRKGEGDELYRFVSDEEFDELIKQDKVLEWAVVHGEEKYGTLEDEIIPFIEKGQIVVREVDVQGFDSITKHNLFCSEDAPYKLESIFIMPENKEVLIERIKDRAPISDQELSRRINSMDMELGYSKKCDHKVYNKQGKLDEAISGIEEILEL